MKKIEDILISTKCVHAGQTPDKQTGAIMTPIFQNSTYAQESPGIHKGFEYSRTQNPTRKVLESCLSSLENAKYGHCFASGCAAITAIMLGLKPGDHIVAMDDLYGGSSRLFNKVFSKFNLSFSYVDLSLENSLEPAIKSNTKIIWIETPSNPLLKIANIQKICNVAKAHNIKVVVDNTFASPIWQNPLDLGADLVLHSTTKYIGGHCDVLGGAILTNDEHWNQELAFLANSIGATPAPFDCFLLLRGIKTLSIRMQKHMENAQIIAEYLASHKNVKKVYFPGLKNHPQHELAVKQMKGFPGVISFVLKDGLAQAIKICEKTKIFTCAESLGGVESLIEHPATMTHASVDKETRNSLGIEDGLIRISVGIEDINDLLRDLEQSI